MLADVFHQEYAQGLIQRAIASGRVPHAYVFHGPEGVGKETLARGLGQLLLCGQANEAALSGRIADQVGLSSIRIGCGTCEDCHLVGAGTHPDMHFIYRQLNREHPDADIRKRKALDIGVEVLRHFVIAKVGLTPYRGRYKIFIVREADLMTTGSQNALLKTLEEPPGNTVIILLVSALEPLMATVLSRCQVVPFDALPMEFIRTRLAEAVPHLTPAQVNWYARGSDGSLGGALEQANDDLHGLNERLLAGLTRMGATRSDTLEKSWKEEAQALGDRYRKRDPDMTDTEAQRRAFGSIFRLAALWYADIMRVAVGETVRVVNASWQGQLAKAAASISVKQAGDAIRRFARAEQELDLNAHTQICIETLINDLLGLATARA